MKRKIYLSTVMAVALTCMATTLAVAQTLAPNPFVTSIFTADPSAHVWGDGRLYVYPSHDIAPPRGCDLMDQYHVYSTDDMVHWTDHGEILRASQVPWGRSEGGFMWAPDCAYKNGTYYFYFPHPSGNGDAWNSTWKIGVATSQSPASGFTVQGYIPGLESLIDPCVFTDDDGQVYFYYGGGNTCKGGRLKANMMEIDGTMQTMQGLEDFHEATWVHKRNGLYYLSYADNNNEGGNRLRYAVSTSPLGPWTSKGVYIDPTGSPTNHGSIIEYKGQSYAFYHNSELSNNPWLRSICVDKLQYNADGTIQKVVMTKPHGTPYGGTPRTIPGTIEAEDYNLGGLAAGYRDNDPENTGGQYRLNEGVDVETCSTGGYSIGFTNDGEYTNYTINVPAAAAYSIRLLVASGSDTGGAFHIEVDDIDVTGTVSFANTGGWQNWTSVNAGSVPLTAGTHVLKFYTKGGMNFDKMIISGGGQSPYSGTPVAIPGTIQAEDYDRGGEGVAYHDISAQNEGGQYRAAEGVDIENCSAGGYNIGFTTGGEWSSYTVNIQRTTQYDINSYVASGNTGGGAFHIEIDGTDVTGTLSIANNGWQTWTTRTASNIQLQAGTHIVRFYTNGGMNIDKIVFVEKQGPYNGIAATVPGTIEAENFDTGGEGIAYHDASAQNEGGQYRNEGVDIENCSAGGYNIGFTAASEWTAYTINAQEAGTYTISCLAASQSGGSFYIEVDGNNVSSTRNVTASGNWQQWGSVSVGTVTLTAGTHTLKFHTNGGMNIDKIVLTKATQAAARQGAISIYPNPSKGTFTIESAPESGTLTVTNSFGQPVYQQDLAKFNGTVDISAQPIGLYIVTITSNGQRNTIQLSKQ